MVARRLAIVLLAAVVPVLAACNSGDGNSSADPATSAATATLWDPCTQIPDDVLRRAGVDPSTKQSGIAGVHQSGWEICNWKGKQYTLAVLSGNHSVQEVTGKEGNVDVQGVTIAGRAGQQFRVDGATKDLTCDVVFPSGQGAIELTVIGSLALDNSGDPCHSLNSVGEQIVPVLPS
ncbi:DUF3558 domain-containing protein [Nocardia spumae]|uniref:DUF3558 domain-containing protein n=1 Tax=Nocardia spumae TaxID=2887190 RepID=UPI001D149669|nr:DUF3558 domain-containing protein [Nocardia spumae]